MSSHLRVTKRNGDLVPVRFDEITNRLEALNERYLGDNPDIDVARITQVVVSSIKPDMKTSKIDDLCASTAAFMGSTNHAYLRLGACILSSNLHEETDAKFSVVVARAYKEHRSDRLY